MAEEPTQDAGLGTLDDFDFGDQEPQQAPTQQGQFQQRESLSDYDFDDPNTFDTRGRIFRGEETSLVPDDVRARWDRKGKIGWAEYSMNFQNDLELVPFVGAAALYDQGTLLYKANRLTANDYTINESGQRQKDYDEVLAFAMKMEEMEHRGLDWGGKLWAGGSQSATFVAELLISRGKFPAYRAAAKKTLEVGAKLTVKQSLKKAISNFAKSAPRALGREAVRTGTFMAHRVGLNYQDRRLNDQLAITDKGQLIMREASEAPATTFARAFSDIFIENITEAYGGQLLGTGVNAIGKTLPKGLITKIVDGLPAGRLKDLFTGTASGTWRFLTASDKKLAWSGIIGEYGEERMGDLLRTFTGDVIDVATGAQDENTFLFDQYVNALFPDQEDVLVELGLFSVFGGVSQVGSKLIRKWEMKGMDDSEIEARLQTMSETEKDFALAQELELEEKRSDLAPPINEEKSLFKKAYRHVINRFAPIEDVSKAAKAKGIEVEKDADPLYLSRQYLGVGPMIKSTLEESTYKIKEDGNIEVTGEGLKPILDALDADVAEVEGSQEARRGDFQDYLLARRTLEDLSPREDVEVSDAQKEKAVADLLKLQEKYGDQIGKFQKLSDRMYGYQARVLSNLVDSGQMSQEAYDAILEKNQRYIPFDRVLPEGSAHDVKISKGFTKVRSPIKKIKGSDLAIENVYESVVKNTMVIMERAQRHKVGKAVANLVDVLPEEIRLMDEFIDEKAAQEGIEEDTDFYDIRDGKISKNGEALSDEILPAETVEGPLDNHYWVDPVDYNAEEMQIADQYRNYVNKNYEKVKADYIERIKQEFNGADNVASGDESKFVLPAVGTENPHLFFLAHPAASAFAKQFRDELLADPSTQGKDVLLTGGGSGAGKTSGLQIWTENLNDYALVIDTNSGDMAGVRKKYEMVKKSGRGMMFIYVERNPVDAWTSEGGGVIQRMVNTGRPVPMKIHMDNQGSRDVARGLATEFAEEIEDDAFQFEVFRRDSGTGGVELLLEESYSEETEDGRKNRDELRGQLEAELDKWLKADKISQGQYEALSYKREDTAQPDDGKVDGALQEVIPRSAMPKGNVIEYYEDGQRKFVEVDSELYESISGMSDQHMDLFWKLLGAPATALRTGATITPDFMMSNFIRDQFTAAIQSNIGFRPFIDPIMSMADIIGKKGDYLDWIRSGSAYSGLVETSRDGLERAVRELSGKRSLISKLNIVTHLSDLSQFFEQATRVGMYRAAKRKGLTDVEAGFEAREGTLDFGVRGASTQKYNAVKSFLNAGIQGFDKNIRTMVKNPVKTTTKGLAYITAPTIMLYLKNRDDEEYWEIPQWRRDIFWNVKVDVAGETTWLSIPKPFGLGQIFGTLPERFLQHIDRGDPHAFDELAGNMADALLPASSVDYLIPTAFVPVLEGSTNYNFFTGRDLVPDYKLDREPFMQFNKGTSETSKEVGKALGISPAKIDNMVQGYLGSSGKYTLEASDALVNGVKKSAGEKVIERPTEVSDLPFVRRFLRDRPFGHQSESVQRFYDLANKLSTINNTANALKQTDREEYAEYRKENLYELRMHKRLSKIKRRVSRFGNEIDIILESDASDAEKLESIDHFERSMTELAKETIEDYEGGK